MTPEEQVRQSFLRMLVNDFDYPQSRIAVEQNIKLGAINRRCDAVVYDKDLKPVCIIEFKATTVQLSQKTFDQISTYNYKLNVRYLIVSNGVQTYVGEINERKLNFLDQIPTYSQLCKKE